SNLAKAKFFVIGKMETGWKIKPFTDEYDKTKEINQNKIFHISLTYLEMAIPFLILVFSLVFLFYRIPYFYILNTLDSFLHIK
ncbi:MAG: RipA family octameric membrane protein, partial [Candidatus Puniceispirillales bacterium]